MLLQTSNQKWPIPDRRTRDGDVRVDLPTATRNAVDASAAPAHNSASRPARGPRFVFYESLRDGFGGGDGGQVRAGAEGGRHTWKASRQLQRLDADQKSPSNWVMRSVAGLDRMRELGLGQSQSQPQSQFAAQPQFRIHASAVDEEVGQAEAREGIEDGSSDIGSDAVGEDEYQKRTQEITSMIDGGSQADDDVVVAPSSSSIISGNQTPTRDPKRRRILYSPSSRHGRRVDSISVASSPMTTRFHQVPISSAQDAVQDQGIASPFSRDEHESYEHGKELPFPPTIQTPATYRSRCHSFSSPRFGGSPTPRFSPDQDPEQLESEVVPESPTRGRERPHQNQQHLSALATPAPIQPRVSFVFQSPLPTSTPARGESSAAASNYSLNQWQRQPPRFFIQPRGKNETRAGAGAASTPARLLYPQLQNITPYNSTATATDTIPHFISPPGPLPAPPTESALDTSRSAQSDPNPPRGPRKNKKQQKNSRASPQSFVPGGAAAQVRAWLFEAEGRRVAAQYGVGYGSDNSGSGRERERKRAGDSDGAARDIFDHGNGFHDGADGVSANSGSITTMNHNSANAKDSEPEPDKLWSNMKADGSESQNRRYEHIVYIVRAVQHRARGYNNLQRQFHGLNDGSDGGGSGQPRTFTLVEGELMSSARAWSRYAAAAAFHSHGPGSDSADLESGPGPPPRAGGRDADVAGEGDSARGPSSRLEINDDDDSNPRRNLKADTSGRNLVEIPDSDSDSGTDIDLDLGVDPDPNPDPGPGSDRDAIPPETSDQAPTGQAETREKQLEQDQPPPPPPPAPLTRLILFGSPMSVQSRNLRPTTAQTIPTTTANMTTTHATSTNPTTAVPPALSSSSSFPSFLQPFPPVTAPNPPPPSFPAPTTPAPAPTHASFFPFPSAPSLFCPAPGDTVGIRRGLVWSVRVPALLGLDIEGAGGSAADGGDYGGEYGCSRYEEEKDDGNGNGSRAEVNGDEDDDDVSGLLRQLERMGRYKGEGGGEGEEEEEWIVGVEWDVL